MLCVRNRFRYNLLLMVRLKDVAQLANVSVATASKVLSGGVESNRISDEVCQRIRESSEKLGYHPNYSARSLQSGRAQAIGSLMGNPDHIDALGVMWWAQINVGLLKATLQHEHQLVSIGGGGSHTSMRQAIQSLQERRIDALVIPGYLSQHPLIEEMETGRMPVVLASGAEERALPTVDFDEVKGVYNGVKHLYDLGHRHLQWVYSRKPNFTGNDTRHKAFEQATRSFGIETQSLVIPSLEAERTTEGDIEGVRQALIQHWSESPPKATAVIAYDEWIAFGVYAAASHIGLSIPHDLSVLAFDDLFASIAYPPMTVVSLRLHEIGIQSVELALQVAAQPDKWSQWRKHRVLVEPQVVVRRSTAPPKPATDLSS